MSAFPGLTPGTWTVDPTHTEVGFVARHLMVAKVRGRFAEVAGSVTAGESFADTTLEAVVQAGSIHTNQNDRDVHLRSADFFDVEQFPTLTLRSTEVTADRLLSLIHI